jgi:hypothetical protein
MMSDPHWEKYAKYAERHGDALAEQCEYLQQGNYELEDKVELLEERLRLLDTLHRSTVEHRDQLWHELQVAYDLVQESLTQEPSYDYDARARAFVDKHTAK